MSKLFLKVPRLIRFLFVFISAMTALFSALRVAFFLKFEDAASPLSSYDFWHAMWLGVRFDLRIALLMILPIFFLGWLKWFNPFYSKVGKYFWLTYLTLIFAIVTVFYIVDFGHYAYLALRLDASALRFLQDFAISKQMVMESYPVGWISLAFILIVSLFAFCIHALYKKCQQQSTPKYGYLSSTIIGVLAFLLFLLGIMGKFSQYPLRWSEATFSANRFATQLTYNPVHFFFDTLKNGGVKYDKAKVKKQYPIMADYLGVKIPDLATLNYQRNAQPMFKRDKKPNVVIVVVESFASYKTSMNGNPLNPTPHFKAMADEGYYFKNYFTPSTGTARSIFTTITSLPDIEVNGTSSRNPLIVNQHSIANDFDGYKKFYFIGGSASWGNIRGILTKNIDNLNLYEEGHYHSPINDVWGISDIDMFREANEVFKKQDKPFLAFIQTAGDHPPYTIPDETYGFKTVEKPLDELKAHGFKSNTEFNAYRLMDYSIGHFIDLAKKAHYARDTIFVFWGDHGLIGSPGKEALKADATSELNLGSHRVPFVIWAPGLIQKPKVYSRIMSEVDALASIASFAGVPYRATALGRDVFDPQYDDKRYAFTVQHGRPLTVGVVNDKYWLKMDAKGGNTHLYDINSSTPKKDITKNHKETAQKMQTLTQAIYTTVQYMLHNNKRENLH